jgi:hypothetical protein
MMMKPLLLLLSLSTLVESFVVPTLNPTHNIKSCPVVPNRQPAFQNKNTLPSGRRQEDFSLSVLLDVPDGFFTFTFPLMGIILSVSKNFGRLRMEERGWEQRVEEGRSKRLSEDPTLTEIELRRKDAALEWSAYGKPRMDEERAEQERQKSRVNVMDRDGEEDDFDERKYRMTDDEVSLFETDYGVEYDPYYDDPYTEEELPDDIPFNVDKKYGDRIYDNGEIFYKEKESGLFYRQGAKPRNLSFWG